MVARPGGEFAARNPRQQWVARFDARGFQLVPDQPETWRWGLELRSWGLSPAGSSTTEGDRPGLDLPVHSPRPDLTGEGSRLTARRDIGLDEWYVNDASGLEHGFTVTHRPSPAASHWLYLELDIRGGGRLRPQLTAANAVRFSDAAGGEVLTYAGLHAWDAAGRELPARLELTPEGRLRLMVDERGARYPVTIDPTVQRAYLKASNTNTGDRFGSSVAIAGDLIAVGAPWEASNAIGVGGNQADNSAVRSGAVYLFIRSGGGGAWRHEAYIKASNTGSGDHFGGALALSGNTLVVGARREQSNATGVNGNQSNNSVMESGAAYVFRKPAGGGWYQEAYLKSDVAVPDQSFGQSVAISGDTVIAGAPGRLALPGAAYVFARSGSTWFHQARLRASNAEGGDGFGGSVAVSADTAVVSAQSEASNAVGVNGDQTNNSAPGAGAAYVFRRAGVIWTQEAYLKASNTARSNIFGGSVAVAGNVVAVGASGRRAAYAFARDSTTGLWQQHAFLEPATSSSSRFGGAIALVARPGAAHTMVVGAPGQTLAGVTTGAAFYFHSINEGRTWKPAESGVYYASNAAISDNLGISVGVSVQKTGVVEGIAGASGEGSGATGVNGDQNDNSALESGAAYVFEIR